MINTFCKLKNTQQKIHPKQGNNRLQNKQFFIKCLESTNEF